MPPENNPSSVSHLSHFSGNSMTFDLQKMLESKRARLDLREVRRGVGVFPGNDDWTSFDFSGLRSGSGSKLKWDPPSQMRPPTF